ncbi:hypothetical protein Rleg9DRAFT_0658 [Rhizobium leguminosarum bv. trifolii WSM597]|uniref:Uncharacterized protein n=1 Tax=Rhizobium leguminosarum bv. trifolii WSM597 TaxID=754764 RepID=I9N5C8_RHILT|nr:hypothetical protein [Rhizobium leguminosarum]EJB01887.1 hypothetical protein Rleg9DRAFT_0658 [Rhizobium leguminosarum bv. trifolii WSM597]
MIQHPGITKPALQPDDVAMLKTVLRLWCQEKSCDICSPAAQHVARELVSWFECGIRDQHKLSGLMRHMHLEVRSFPHRLFGPRRASQPAVFGGYND